MADFYNPQRFNESYGILNRGADAALPSPESMDLAAARLRSRTDNYAKAQGQTTQDQYASRGMGNSGAYRLAQQRNTQSAGNSYASGLADIQNDYWTQRQKGAETLGNIGASYGNVAGSEAEAGINQGLGQGKLNIEQQNTDTDKLRALNDFFTSYGTVGGALGGTNGANGSQTAAGFNSLKQYLFQMLGLGY